MTAPPSIAIDGPVASGKTAVGRAVARRLRCRFLDTGTMYRAVTWAAIVRDIDLDDRESLSRLASGLNMGLVADDSEDRLLVDGEDVTAHLRDAAVERSVSIVSTVSGVRTAMVEQQRGIAAEGPTVMVGRDIGTVVLPQATLKIFLTASEGVRAQRRFDELSAGRKSPDYDRLLEDLVRRDKIDSARANSPLRPAADATRIDTDGMGVDEVAAKILSLVELSGWDSSTQ